MYESVSPSKVIVDINGLVTALSTEGRCVGCAETINVIAVNEQVFDVFELSITQGDTDNDNIGDAWETEHGLNPSDPSDADKDIDEDDLSNLKEFQTGTDPQNKAVSERAVSGSELLKSLT